MLLWRCIDNNSYQGCSPPERQEFVKDEYGSNENGENYGNNNEDNHGNDNETGWGEEPLQEEFPKPVTDEAEWSDGWK